MATPERTRDTDTAAYRDAVDLVLSSIPAADWQIALKATLDCLIVACDPGISNHAIQPDEPIECGSIAAAEDVLMTHEDSDPARIVLEERLSASLASHMDMLSLPH